MAEVAVRLTGGHNHSPLCVDSKPDGTCIVSGGEEGEICLWCRDGQLQHKLHEQEEDCTSIYVSKTQDNIFYASSGTVVKVFDDRNLQSPVENYQFNEEEVNQIVLDEKEQYLAAADDSGEVKIISLQEKRLYKTLRRKHTNICATVCFRYKKPWEIFTGGMDCNLIHWDFSRPKCLNQLNMQELQDAPSELGAYLVNPPFVHHLSMSKDGKYLACALENGFVSVFDAGRKNISEKYTLHTHSQGVSQVSFVSETKIITGGNDSVIAGWDLSKATEDQVPNQSQATNGHTSPIHDQNAQLTDSCRLFEIQHTSKINWLKPFSHAGHNFVIVADQSTDLAVIPIEL